MADIEVKMGNIAVTKAGDNLVASGIGSCLVITLYDPKLKTGGLAHAMLSPHPRAGADSQIVPKSNEGGDTKYVHTAINQMLQLMEAEGAKREDIEAKLIGGANVFSAFESDIGKRNVLSAKEKLKEERVKLVGEVVGGSQGRSVEFSVASGIVTVKTKF